MCKLTDELLQQIAKDEYSPRCLDLSNQNLADDDLDKLCKALKTNHTISELKLINNQITQAGVKHLSNLLFKNNTITQIKLKNNLIDSFGAIYLSNGLEKNTSVQELDLSNNKIGYEGIIALHNMLEKNTTLLVLNVEDNPSDRNKNTAEQVNHIMKLESRNNAILTIQCHLKIALALVQSLDKPNSEEDRKDSLALLLRLRDEVDKIYAQHKKRKVITELKKSKKSWLQFLNQAYEKHKINELKLSRQEEKELSDYSSALKPII